MSSEDTSEDEYYPPTTREREHRTARKSTASNSQQVSSSSSGYSTRQAARNASKALRASSEHFMADFNPETSIREKRKLNRKINPPSNIRRPPGAIYDDNGIHVATGMDLCDCLNENCLGCFTECIRCGSQKCGTECRVHRKYVIEQIEYHGYDHIIKNPLIKY